MLEDLETGTLITSIVLYVIVGIGMWTLIWKKYPVFGLDVKIAFYLIMLPVSYFIVNHYKNK